MKTFGQREFENELDTMKLVDTIQNLENEMAQTIRKTQQSAEEQLDSAIQQAEDLRQQAQTEGQREGQNHRQALLDEARLQADAREREARNLASRILALADIKELTSSALSLIMPGWDSHEK